MDAGIRDWLIVAAMGTLCIAAMGALVRAGFLRPSGLDDAPPRRLDLTGLDLALATAVLIVGASAAELVGRQLGISDVPAGATAARIDPTLALALRQVFAQVIGQGGILIYVILRVRGSPGGLGELGLRVRGLGGHVAVGAMAFLAAAPIVIGLIALTALVGEALGYPKPPVAHEMLRMMRESQSALAVALLVVSAVLLAPFFEEVMFRGLLQSVLLNYLGPGRRWAVVVLAALLFTMVHLSAVAWQALPGLFMLGLVLGWLYERRGSLWPAIVLHVGFNAANTGLAFLLPALEGKGP